MELKEFNSKLEKLAYRHGMHHVFDDFLDMIINGFCFNYTYFDSKMLQSRYTLEERHQFGNLIYDLIKLLDTKIQSNTDWFDALGSIYELNSLTSKKYFAQFFTPEPVCNFMAQIVIDELSQQETIIEPAAGSGRNCLAAHVINTKLFHVAIDLDYTCAKMTAINFMFHGIDGIVISDNGLFEKQNFRGAFIVNRNLKHTGVPQIEFVTNANEAYRYSDFRHKLISGKAFLELSIPSNVTLPKENTFKFETPIFKSSEQLHLF